MKTVYVANSVHPNMNYDRSCKSVIWEKFPAIYRLFLDYVEEHPDVKVHFQLPGQTFNSLKICAPDVVERIKRLHEGKQVRFMGTYYSEPVGMCMDGMTALDSALLGTCITARELGSPEGFFIQEIAYFPQLPYIINRLGVRWVILTDWDRDIYYPYTLEGLDGSRCVGVPCISVRDIPSIDLENIPENALLMFHNDLEIPGTVKRCDELRERLSALGVSAQWTYVSDYIARHGLHGSKAPGPSTNKSEGSTRSPSHSRWVSKPIDIETHRLTLSAMEAYRYAGALSLAGDAGLSVGHQAQGHPRSYITWDVESLNDYPSVQGDYLANDGVVHPLDRVRHLLAWSTNSDARGWYPMYERTAERREGFAEASMIADAYTKKLLRSRQDTKKPAGPGYWAINNFPLTGFLQSLTASEPLDLANENGGIRVVSIRPVPGGYEHLIRLDVPPYHAAPIVCGENTADRLVEVHQGNAVSKAGMSLEEQDGDLVIRRGPQTARLSLEPFKILVRRLDSRLRTLNPEGPTRVRVVDGEYPSLMVEKQIDWHIHFQCTYTTDGDSVFATWRLFFTAPTLVDTEIPKEPAETDFAPGGIKARLSTQQPGEIWYDGPFGEIRHDWSDRSYIAALTHVFCQGENGGFLVASQTGAQSFQVCGERGEIALCLGRSNTSGGRRKLNFQVGNDVYDVETEKEWYREPFYGEHVHRFVVRPFSGTASDGFVPVWGKALSVGVPMVSCVRVHPSPPVELYRLTPTNVSLAGVRHGDRTLVLNELCGVASSFELNVGGRRYTGQIGRFGIMELPVQPDRVSV